MSLVVRTTGSRKAELARALQSIVANSYRPIELIVVYQGRDVKKRETVRKITGEVAVDLAFSVIHNPRDDDRRAENLNIGWERAKGRYIGFLDDDDALKAEHVSGLVKLIRASGAAWAYGQTELVREDQDLQALGRAYPFLRPRYSYTELLIENFIPIHSFLIDRSKLVPNLEERPFFEPLTRGEDWDFLVRLAHHHVPAVLNEVTCTYFASMTGRNVNASLFGGTDDNRREEWRRSEGLLAQRRRDLLIGSSHREDFLRAVRTSGTLGVPARMLRKVSLHLNRRRFERSQSKLDG